MSDRLSLAAWYDVLNDGADYEKDLAAFAPHLPESSAQGLDLGCGTGDFTLLLAKRYAMCAIDRDPEMLAAAEQKARASEQQIQFLEQDMRSFRLSHKVAFCTMLHDTVNYLATESELEKTFSAVKSALLPDGVFLFDLNTERRFTERYADHVSVFEREHLYCTLSCDYRARTRACDFWFDLFVETNSGDYHRQTFTERQYYYPLATVKKALLSAGFSSARVISHTRDRLFLKAETKTIKES